MSALRRTSAIWLLGALAALGCGSSPAAPRVEGGVLDLSAWDFGSRGVVALHGVWQICWGEFVSPDADACPGRGWQSFPVPRLWSDAGSESPIRGRGIATYRLRIELPPERGPLTLRLGSPMTAYRLFVNGEPRGGVGTPGRSAETTLPKLENRRFGLPADASRLELRVHVANFQFRGGGLRRTSYLGLDRQIAARDGRELALYAAFAATSAAVGLFFLAQFAFRPSERARAWFGLFALGVGARMLPGSASDLYQLTLGWLSFPTLLRLEYANTALLIFVGGAYLRAKVPDVMPPRITQVLQYSALALVPIHVLGSLDTVMATLPIILALPPLGMALALVSYGRAHRRGIPGAGPTFAAAAVFTAGVLHDVIRTQTGLGAPIELFPYFVVAWMASEAHSLLQSFARSFASVESLSQRLEDANFELQETEEVVVRFVPFAFLRALGKPSIREVRAGDRIVVDLTLLCCELRIPGRPAGAPDFDFLGELLARLEPGIRARGGYWSPRLGDRLVAFFPGPPDAALAVAGEIHRIARTLAPTGEAEVRVGIATGPVTVGTLGGPENLSTVAIGPTVSLASRLLEGARSLGVGTLVSAATRGRLGPKERAALRERPPLEGEGDGPVFELCDAEEGEASGAG